jgi:hypothetical protein
MTFPHIWLDQNNIINIKRGNITHHLILEGLDAIGHATLLADIKISSLVKPPDVYGCRCGVVDNPNCLMTSAKMRFFWMSLSTMKYNGFPFTHICEWKRRSPSSGSTGSSGLIVVVATVTMGSVSMIFFFHYFLDQILNQSSAPCL